LAVPLLVAAAAAAQDAGTDAPILSNDAGADASSASGDGGGDAPTVPDCTSLPNPLFLVGSKSFEPVVGAFAIKLAALATGPMTVVFQTPGSCLGVTQLTNKDDIAGAAHTYTADGTSVVINECKLAAAGQKADVAISDVFYDSCPGISPPALPTTIKDFRGPVLPAVLVVVAGVMTADATYITALEAQDLFGCGAGYSGNNTPWMDPLVSFCLDPSAGTQIVVGKSIGVPAATMVDPICVPTSGNAGMLNAFHLSPNSSSTIGFLSEDVYDSQRKMPRNNLRALAFQGFDENRAYFPDREGRTSAAGSLAGTYERANVRDGHYLIWGYEHMFAPVDGSGVPTNPRAADFIGYINGTKTVPSIDPLAIEGTAGLVPLCAMKVRRAVDGGPLSYENEVTDPCGCAYEAAVTGFTPSQCPVCQGTGASACPAGYSCHHGLCEPP